MKFYICINCSKENKTRYTTANKFCNNVCQQDYQKRKRLEDWQTGKLSGNVGSKVIQTAAWLRKYLINKANYSCEKCGFNTPHPDDQSSILEINHKDGDALNTCLDNLEVICPNCHALTSTYRRRNKQGKRRLQSIAGDAPDL